MIGKCPVCLSRAERRVLEDSDEYQCPKCGHYRITGTALGLLERHGDGANRIMLSAQIRGLAERQAPGMTIVNSDNALALITAAWAR